MLIMPKWMLEQHTWIETCKWAVAVVVDSLFIVLLPLFVFCPRFVMHYLHVVSFLVLQSYRRGRAVCFTFIVSLVSCDCHCSVALPHGAVGWSAVFVCGIY